VPLSDDWLPTLFLSLLVMPHVEILHPKCRGHMVSLLKSVIVFNWEFITYQKDVVAMQV